MQLTAGIIAVAAFWVAALSSGPSAWAAPVNDGFSDASALSGDSGMVTGTTKTATVESGEPSHWWENVTASVWYRWTATDDGVFFVDTCGNGDAVDAVAIYLGEAVDDLIEEASSRCRVAVRVVSGQVYRIAVASYPESAGAFKLTYSVHLPPENDDIANAFELTSDSGARAGTTLGGSRQAGEADHGDSGADSTVWYVWKPDASGTVLLGDCSTGVVEAVALYRESGQGSLEKVKSSYCRLGARVEAGTTYRIAVGSYTRSSGEFLLEWSVVTPPSNDDFASAANISGPSVRTSGTTLGAITELGEPADENYGTDGSVWYRWTAPKSGLLNLSACNQDYTVESLALYTGGSLASLRQVQGAGCGIQDQRVKKGVTYLIRAGSYSNNGGPFTLRLSLRQAAILTVSRIRPKSAKVKPGGTVKLRVTVKNSGTLAASKVKVCGNVHKTKCVNAGNIKVGGSRTVTLPVKTKRSDKGKTGVWVDASAPGRPLVIGTMFHITVKR